MSEPRILIVEDEPDLLRALSLNLTAEGFAVLTASRGDIGVEQALRERPDLVLLDIMLPGMNGLDVCRELRRKGFEAPIIMLTAKAEELDRVVGLEIGADDYVTKPFGVRELLARIRVRLRRHTTATESDAKLRFGKVAIDFDRHEAERAGERVELTAKEFDVLRLLAPSRRNRHPRPPARRGLGIRDLPDHPHRRQSHSPAPPEIGRRPIQPAPHPFDLRRRLQVY